MTLPTNTTQTYAQVGIREDLSDIIYDISPTDTPFLTRAARAKAKQTYHEWQTDALAAAAANRKIEGDDPTAVAITATARVGNYTQISEKTVVVSGTADAVDTAGRKSELAYQVMKRGKEIKRDMEFALVQNQASSAGGAATARSLASVESWLKTNKTSVGTGTAQTTPGFSSGTVAAPTDSSVLGTFTEASLKAVIAAAWTAGGAPDLVLLNASQKQRASGFTGIATQYRDNKGTSQAKIIAAADVYVSDFGVFNIVPDRFMRAPSILVLDMEYWAVAYLRPFQTTPLAKTGDSEKRMLLVEYTLESRNEQASGKVTDAV